MEQGTMAIMGSTEALRKHLKEVAPELIPEGILGGDTKLVWDKSNDIEVASARKTFDDLVNTKRFLAYKVLETGEKGERIYQFDRYATKLILVPPMVGG